MNHEILSRLDITIESFWKNLMLRIFLQLAMDEPNAYWEVLRKTDKMLVGDNYSKTVNIGSCLQHNIHGIFETGDWDVHKILKSMLWLLHHSPARRNIFVTEGRSDVFPLRYY